jgi:hypothetical protein
MSNTNTAAFQAVQVIILMLPECLNIWVLARKPSHMRRLQQHTAGTSPFDNNRVKNTEILDGKP